MKQAILITAYKNAEQLTDIINHFDGNNFQFYVHIDKKSKLNFDALKSIKEKKIFISRKYTVNWGGRNHLRAILLLAGEALKDKEVKFFHLISGQDFPVKNSFYFNEVLDKSKDYLEYFELPSTNWNLGGLNRLEFYNFYDLFDATKDERIILYLLKVQQKLKIKRAISKKVPKLYGGSTWWSLTRETLNYVIDYTRSEKRLLKRMRHSFCSEEMYLQTIIMNSNYSKNVVNHNLRYIDWESGRGGAPAVVDVTDFTSIINSDKLFARKFKSPESDELKLLLKQRLASAGQAM